MIHNHFLSILLWISHRILWTSIIHIWSLLSFYDLSSKKQISSLFNLFFIHFHTQFTFSGFLPMSTPKKDPHTITIAVTGCSHGSFDTFYRMIELYEEEYHKKVDLLIVPGDLETIRNQYDLNCVHCPPKYLEMVCSLSWTNEWVAFIHIVLIEFMCIGRFLPVLLWETGSIGSHNHYRRQPWSRKLPPGGVLGRVPRKEHLLHGKQQRDQLWRTSHRWHFRNSQILWCHERILREAPLWQSVDCQHQPHETIRNRQVFVVKGTSGYYDFAWLARCDL